MVRKRVKYFFHRAINPFKSIKIFIKRKLGWLGTPVILPYTVYGNRSKIYITGAIIEEKGLSGPDIENNIWKNFLAMIKRYSGDEIAGVRLRIEFQGIEEIVMTNKKGLFHTVMPCTAEADSLNPNESVKFIMIDEVVENQGVIETTANVHFVDEQCDFNIISDIDDTIMISHSTSFFKKMRLMMFKNAHSRKPFDGIEEFYNSLIKSNNNFRRSIFYVSGSEWNLYDLLVDFIRYWHIPEGPILLSEMKTSLLHLFRSEKKVGDKLGRIQELFEVFSDQKFILIGDSGQKDPELYLEISKMFPSRMVLIYIRYIGNKKHNKRLEKLIETAGILGVEMVLVKDTAQAYQHAVESGIIK